MKPASDKNIPEGTVIDLRSARHLPPFSGESGDTKKQKKGAKNSDTTAKKPKTFEHMLSLTYHLQHGGGHQVSIPISDFIHPIVPWGQPRYDDLIDGAIPAHRDEAPVSHVEVCYLALADKLHGATGGFWVKRAQGGLIRVSGGGKNEMGMRDRKKEGQV